MQKQSSSLLLAALLLIGFASAPAAAQDEGHSYSNMGANAGDMGLRVDRPRPAPKHRARAATVAMAAPGAALLGATDVYSYDESGFQTLPTRVACVTNYDATQQKWISHNVHLSKIIQDEARLQGLDPLIVEIIIGHESAFNCDAQSGVGACGLMQLMPETAATLGCTDITDPAQNIAAGTRYFAQQYRRFGNLHLALAAYNAGPGSVESYGGVPPYEETINYASSIAQEYERRRKRV